MRLALGPFALLVAAASTVACSGDPAPPDARQSEALVGSTTVLASHLAQPGSVVLDAARVYWTTAGADIGDGAIASVSKLGGTPLTLASHQRVPFGIAVDDTRVYWVNYAAGGPGGALMAVSKYGGTPVALATSDDGPRTVVVDASRAYFLTSSAVMAVSKLGGAATNVAGTQCGGGIAQDDANLYWIVNCVMFPPQGIFKVSKLGGPVVKLSDDAPGAIVVASDGITWMNPDGTVARLSKMGGTAVRVATFPSPSSNVLALDASSFYGVSASSLVKESRFGGPATPLATGAVGVGAIAVDASYVYWTSSGPADARLLRALKY